MLSDPDTQAGLVASLPDGTPQIRTPIRIDAKPLPLSGSPPSIGQHTDQIRAAVRGERPPA
jgi:crotonobetainyl-CoA:carnitine CoA-transferase CaiB-like acyl-CoA transferase